LYNRPEVAAVPSGLSPTPLIIKESLCSMELVVMKMIVVRAAMMMLISSEAIIKVSFLFLRAFGVANQLLVW
jgi:hypothetical protein